MIKEISKPIYHHILIHKTQLNMRATIRYEILLSVSDAVR